jgi:GntR family transcriptional regulator of arabinose operon
MILDLTQYNIDSKSQAPKYLQLKNILKDMASRMQPHEMLPSENQLAKQFHVHRLTSRQAITELVNEGLLYREHGKGTFISSFDLSQEKKGQKNIGCYFRRLRSRRDDDNFFLEVFEGFEDELTENNCFMVYRSFCQNSMPDDKTVAENARELLETDIGALVFDERVSDDAIKGLFPCDKKIAVVNRKSNLEGVLSAYPDNRAYARKILEYLSGLNHKKLLYIYELEMPNQIQMLKYLKTDCEEYGFSPENIHVKAARETNFTGKVYRDATFEGITEFSPTTIIAGFDWIANNVYAQASEMGISIPRDMSVISVGDYAIASRLEPPLTTLKLNTNELGRSLAKLVVEGRKKDILIEPELIERSSCSKI